MHFHCGDAEGRAQVVEVDVGVVGQQGHGHGAVRDFFGDHERGEPHAKGVVVHALSLIHI